MSTDIDPAVYRKAAQVIRTGGLTQGAFFTDDGKHCTVGALRTLTGSLPETYRFLPLLADLIGGPQPCPCGGTGCGTALDPYGNVTRWNDHPQRTPDDVLLLLEQAAEKLEADR